MAIGILKLVTAMSVCQELAALVTRHTDDLGNGAHKTAIPQLEFMRKSVVSTAMCGVAEPILAIVVQGKKEALLGEETYQYGAAQYLVVSVELPPQSPHQCGAIGGGISQPSCCHGSEGQRCLEACTAETASGECGA
jgi:hypothetical protein